MTLTRLLGALVASVLVVGFLLVAVFPTRTLISQRSETGRARSELSDLERSNAELQDRIDELKTPGAIEKVAREDYGMVRPGEEAYAILPRPEAAVALPEVWPFVGVADALNR